MSSSQAGTEIAPHGKLRVGLAVGPALSPGWSRREPADGPLVGVTAGLGEAMGRRLGLPVAFVDFVSSGAVIDAADQDVWDIAFAPVDDVRKTRVLFGPDYYLGESTFAVTAGFDASSVADVDRSGVTVVGVESTATLRSARKFLRHATAIGTAGLDEALGLFRAGSAQAIALGRESLASLIDRLPGARILDGHFHAAGYAVAVPLGRPDALAAVSELLEALKSDGTLRAVFDANGFAALAVAPPGSRS